VAVCVALPLPAAAQEPAVPPQAEPPPPGLIQRQHNRISNTLEALLQRTDALFGGDRAYDMPTGSYVRIGAREVLYRPQDRDNELTSLVSAKIGLPRTQDRLQVTLQQDIEDALLTRSQREAQVEAGQAPAEQQQYFGLRGVAVEKLKLQIHGDVGIKLRMPPDPYARLRVQRVFEKRGEWVPAFAETLLWRRTEKVSVATEFALGRAYGTQSALSLITNATWRQTKDAFDLSEVANFTHRINERSLAGLEGGVLGDTQGNAWITAYYVSVRYRRKIYSDWLLFEVRPQLTYPRDRDFRPVPSLTLQIEAYFGRNLLDKM
jgi:hypothetical protein